MALLEVKNIKKSFGNNKVLKGINFSLEKGEVLAIIGSSGSGKTTLLRCLNFLESIDSGKIIVDNDMLLNIHDNNYFKYKNLPYNEQILFDESDNKNTNIKLLKNRKCGRIYAKHYAIKTSRKQKENANDIRKKRLHFGLVFQNFNLFPHYNILKNITLADSLLAKEMLDNKYKQIKAENKGLTRKEIKNLKENAKSEIIDTLEDKAQSLLDRVGLGDRAKAYPCELSGGQQQRVAIARALALSPDILCFDEPTSALDPELTGEVLKVIKDLKSGDRTMIVVTHEMNFAKNVADKIIFMADGIIEEIGTPEQVFENPQSEKTKAFLQKSLED